MKKRILAIPAAAAAMSVNPKSAAMIATIKKIIAHLSMMISSLKEYAGLPVPCFQHRPTLFLQPVTGNYEPVQGMPQHKSGLSFVSKPLSRHPSEDFGFCLLRSIAVGPCSIIGPTLLESYKANCVFGPCFGSRGRELRWNMCRLYHHICSIVVVVRFVFKFVSVERFPRFLIYILREGEI